MAKKARILYLCAGSSVLAYMAEGFTRYYGGIGIDIQSIVQGSIETHPYCSWAMNETGIDIGDIKLLNNRPGDLASFTHIVSLHSTESDITDDFPSGIQRESWELPDPVKVRGRPEEVILAFRSVRNQIEKNVKGLLTKIFEK